MAKIRGATAGRQYALVALGVLALAAGVRIAYIAAVTSGDRGSGDQIYYSVQAHMNAMGRWFGQPFTERAPGADHPPLTVLMLTPITWLFRHGDFVVAQRAFTAAVGIANVGLVAELVRRIANVRAALLAALLAAVHASFWMGDALILSEPYAIAAMLLFLIASLRLIERPGIGRAITAGALGGVVALARSELLLLVPAVALVIFANRRVAAEHPPERTRRRLGIAGIFVASSLVVIGPWVAWNSARFEDRVTLSTNDGFTLLGSNCPAAYYGSTTGSYQISCALDAVIQPDLDASQASAIRSRLAVDYAKAHAGRLPVVVAARVARVWLAFDPGIEVDGGPGEGRPRWAMVIGIVQFWALVPLAAIGLRHLDRGRRRLLLVVPLVTTIAAVVVAAYWRIRIPSDVVLVALAGVGLDRLLARMDRRAAPRSEPEFGGDHLDQQPELIDLAVVGDDEIGDRTPIVV